MGFYFETNSLTPSKGGSGGGGTGVINSLNVTPTTSAQTFNASDVDGYKPVEVAAVTASIDANIQAGNIVSGKSILGVNGSAIELSGENIGNSVWLKDGDSQEDYIEVKQEDDENPSD